MNSYNYEDDFDVYSSKASKYKRKEKKLMSFVLIVFSMILIAGAFSYLLFFKNSFVVGHSNYKNNVHIVYLNDMHGALVDDFSKYDSINNAFFYSFYIKNDNNFYINYSVNLFDTLNGEYDISSICYELYKNDRLTFKGSLGDDLSLPLLTDKLYSQSTDNFVLKLWTDSSNIKLGFSIDVEVGE